MWKGVYFTQSEYFFHSLNSKKTLCFSALETTQKWRRTHMLAKTMSESQPPSHVFLSSSHIKLRWKMMELNIKVEIISLLLARIHRKMETLSLLLRFSRNLVAARRSTAPVRKFTKSPYTSLKLDYLRVFNKLFRVDGKGACFAI